MTDILICSMPLMFDIGRAPGAPALLKSAAQNTGYTATTVDLNLEYFNNQCCRDINLYYTLGCVWRPYDSVTEDAEAAAEKWTNESINLIKKYKPKIIAISVFTNWQHRSTWRLLNKLKVELPSIPVIVGGFGCEASANSLNGIEKISKLDGVKPFWQLLKDRNLVDQVALGGGGSLDEFVSFLDFKLKQINSTVQKNETVIYSAPIPDYSDYDFDQYIWQNQKSIAITGSKGCVRACTFCDVPGQFGRFRYRQGKDIAEEMIYQYQKHGIKQFEFTDSLVNGSLKAFREWLTIIAEYNDSKKDSEKISWFGQYICRPQTQISSEIYDLMRRSGVSSLIIGVESGSDAVLEAMKKKITVKDVYEELEQFYKHGISCDILVLSGFYNETHERFVETLHFIQKCQKYLVNGTINSLGLGAPLYINDQMYIGQHAEELGIIKDEQYDFLWTLASDPDNTYITRVQRRITAQLVLDLLGYSLSIQHISNLQQLYSRLETQELKLLKELDEITTASVV
jgi:tRNA A37 methylthiotransferase MiaB